MRTLVIVVGDPGADQVAQFVERGHVGIGTRDLARPGDHELMAVGTTGRVGVHETDQQTREPIGERAEESLDELGLRIVRAGELRFHAEFGQDAAPFESVTYGLGRLAPLIRGAVPLRGERPLPRFRAAARPHGQWAP